MTKFGIVLLFVRNFNRCLKFYRNVFGLKASRLYRGTKHPDWAEFQLGAIRFALHAERGYSGPQLKICRPVALHFIVTDIRHTLAKVEKYGGRIVRAPRKVGLFPELEIVYAATIRDPDGNEFDIHQLLKRYRNAKQYSIAELAL